MFSFRWQLSWIGIYILVYRQLIDFLEFTVLLDIIPLHDLHTLNCDPIPSFHCVENIMYQSTVAACSGYVYSVPLNHVPHIPTLSPPHHSSEH